jgi:hypothetical protein
MYAQISPFQIKKIIKQIEFFFQRFADLHWGGLTPQMLIRRIAPTVTAKLSSKNKDPLIANMLLVIIVLCKPIIQNKFNALESN